MEKLLKSYQPDLVQLKGMFSQNPRTDEQSMALTLSLPTGKLHATGSGKNMLAACKKAFSEVESQLKKHQSLLRHEHEWKRKRASAPRWNRCSAAFCTLSTHHVFLPPVRLSYAAAVSVRRSFRVN